MKCKAYFGTNRFSLFFFKIFYAIFYSSYVSLLGSVLEVIKKSRPFVRGSVSIWVNCLEGILITHFFLSVILVTICVTLFLLINSLNFRICLFFVHSKDLLYEFSWIASKRWNSSGVIDSNILVSNCLILFLSLSYNVI